MSFLFHFSWLSRRKAKCFNCVTIVTLDQRWSCRVKRTQSFFRQNSILKHPVLYISFYITCINSFMSLYRTTSSRPDPVWLPSAVQGTFSFPVCAFNTGTAELWGWVGCSPTKNNLWLSLLFILIFVLKKFDKFFLGLKRVSGDFRSSRFQNLPGEHPPGHPVSSLSVLRKSY